MSRVHRIIGRVVTLAACVGIATPQVSSADDTPSTAERLEASLLHMGYIDIESNGCDIAFSRRLNNSCPTDQELSYRRIINLKNIDMATITAVVKVEYDGKSYYEIQAPPTEEYTRLEPALLDFEFMRKMEYRSSFYPFQFDDLTPLLAQHFYKAIPKDTDANWWISQTCFGEAPYVYTTFRMSYDDEAKLSAFREALLDHAEQSGCVAD